MKLAVLASGEGTNLQAILDAFSGSSRVELVAVASNKSQAHALKRSHEAGVETKVFELSNFPSREQRDLAMATWLRDRGVELAVLAGYMELVCQKFLERFPKGVINVHPSLLPAFPGMHAIEQQLDSGCLVGGVTVHYVDSGIDSGQIITQEAVELPSSRDLDQTKELMHEVEHRLLPEAIRLIADEEVTIQPLRGM